nr:hypothetical protein [uncultured Sphingomonas sp.]
MRCLIAAAAIALTAPLGAQTGWVPGSEIVGQSAQVTTADVTNTVYLDPNGRARIVTPAGRTVPASWTASQQKLCLYSGGASECWPYDAPFQAKKLTALSSSCGGLSEWVMNGVNPQPTPPPPPVSNVLGERG